MLSEVTVSLNIKDKVGDTFDARRTKAYMLTSADVVHDTDGHETRVGSGNGTVGADGIVTWDVWTPGTGSNPAEWQTTFYVDVPDRNAKGGRKTLTFGPYTITEAAWIDELDEEQAVSPTYAGALVAQLEAIRDEAAAISGLTGEDDAVALLVSTPGSDTATALSATIATGIDGGTVRNYADAGSLRQWRTAVSRVLAGVTDAKLLVLGDSIAWGYGSTSNDPRNGLTGRLAARLGVTTPTTHGLIPAPSNIVGGVWPDGRIAAGAGWSGVNLGWAGHSCLEGVVGAGDLTFSGNDVLCDSVDIYYIRAPGNGTFLTNWPGASIAPVNTAAAAGIGKATITGGTRSATNTLTIGGISVGNVDILGVEFYDSTTRQVRVGCAGVNSTTAAMWNASGGYASLEAVKAYAPNLTLILLGHNDAANAITATAWADSVAGIKAAAELSGDVVILSCIPSSTGSSASPTLEAAYRDEALARGWAVIDIFGRFGNFTTANNLGWMADSLHPNDLGYEDIAAGIVEALPISGAERNLRSNHIAPTLLNGWSNYGSGYAPAAYAKDAAGFVHLQGLVKNTVSAPSVIFNLPAGCRPAGTLFGVPMTTNTGLTGQFDVLANGDVKFNAGGIDFFSLTGFSFLAQQ